MDTLSEKFSVLRQVLLQRASSSLGANVLKAFVQSLDEYQDALALALSTSEKQTADVKEENTILRSIVGLNADDLRATVVQQGAEIRFLRDQVVGLKKTIEEKEKKNDGLLFELECRKKELTDLAAQRTKEQDAFNEQLTGIRGQLTEFTSKVEKKSTEVETQKKNLDRTIADAHKTLYSRSGTDTSSVVSRLSVMVSIIASSLRNVRTYLEQQAAAAAKKKGEAEHLRQLSLDLDVTLQQCDEITAAVQDYAGIYQDRPLKPAPVDWAPLWETIKKKYGAIASGRKIKMLWPEPRKLPGLTADQAALAAILEALVVNALEASGPNGEIACEALSAGGLVHLAVRDQGSGIRAEDRPRLFQPFFSTKPNHTGLGLHRARHFAALLGGDVRFEPQTRGSLFTLRVPQQD